VFCGYFSLSKGFLRTEKKVRKHWLKNDYLSIVIQNINKVFVFVTNLAGMSAEARRLQPLLLASFSSRAIRDLAWII
jgi:hypothetical protein